MTPSTLESASRASRRDSWRDGPGRAMGGTRGRHRALLAEERERPATFPGGGHVAHTSVAAVVRPYLRLKHVL